MTRDKKAPSRLPPRGAGEVQLPTTRLSHQHQAATLGRYPWRRDFDLLTWKDQARRYRMQHGPTGYPAEVML